MKYLFEYNNCMWRQGTQMGIEPMTFRTLDGRSTTEPRELIWRTRSQYWVMIHGLYHTITGITLVYHGHSNRLNCITQSL